MVTLTPEIIEKINKNPNSSIQLPETDGVLIAQVISNSPAAKGGLRLGDVVTEIDGQKIATAEELQSIVQKGQIGKPLNITVKRGKETQTFSVSPQELQDAN